MNCFIRCAFAIGLFHIPYSVYGWLYFSFMLYIINRIYTHYTVYDYQSPFSSMIKPLSISNSLNLLCFALVIRNIFSLSFSLLSLLLAFLLLALENGSNSIWIDFILYLYIFILCVRLLLLLMYFARLFFNLLCCFICKQTFNLFLNIFYWKERS